MCSSAPLLPPPLGRRTSPAYAGRFSSLHVKITITHIGALNYVEFRAAMNLTWCEFGALNHVRFRARHAPYVVHGGERGIRTLDPVLSGILA